MDSFAIRLLVFNSSLAGARTPQGDMNRISITEPLAHKHVSWYENSTTAKQYLVQFLLELDIHARTDQDNAYCRQIREDMDRIINTISQKIGEQMPVFRGNIVRMGSSHNGTKIGKPDEFDFTFELNLPTLLNEHTYVETLKTENNRVRIYLENQYGFPDLSVFDLVGYPKDSETLDFCLSINGNKDKERYKSAISKEENKHVLNTESVGFALYNVLDTVVSAMTLPDNWSHGGYRYPYYSGIRLNIPAFLLQFAYKAPGAEQPLFISVDFAPVLRLPNIQVVSNDVVYQHLLQNDYVNYHWQRLECGSFRMGGYIGMAEEAWFAEYPPDSVAKIVIRVCKALHNMVKLDTPKFIRRDLVEKISELLKRDKKNGQDLYEHDFMMLEIYHYQRIRQPNLEGKYATFEDMCETAGSHHYITSYIFKRVVFTLMVLDENHGRDWTKEDLSDIVLSIYLFINDLIISVNQGTIIPISSKSENDDSCVVKMIRRSELTDKLQNDMESDNASVKGKTHRQSLEIDFSRFRQETSPITIYERNPERPKSTVSPLKWYFNLHNALAEGKCDFLASLFLRNEFSATSRNVGLDEGISRVLQLLKSASEGVEKAVIYTEEDVEPLTDSNDREINIDDVLITKEELKTLLCDNKSRM